MGRQGGLGTNRARLAIRGVFLFAWFAASQSLALTPRLSSVADSLADTHVTIDITTVDVQNDLPFVIESVDALFSYDPQYLRFDGARTGPALSGGTFDPVIEFNDLGASVAVSAAVISGADMAEGAVILHLDFSVLPALGSGTTRIGLEYLVLSEALEVGADDVPAGDGTVSGAVQQASLELTRGLNLYAPSSEVGATVTGCYSLLEHLGGDGIVSSITRIDRAAQMSERCQFDADSATGIDFAVEVGEGYLVQLVTASTVQYGTTACPPTDLSVGMNIIGLMAPAAGMTCAMALEQLGARTLETLDPAQQRFRACFRDDIGDVRGDDFPLAPRHGYLAFADSDAGPVNLNDTSDPSCN